MGEIYTGGGYFELEAWFELSGGGYENLENFFFHLIIKSIVAERYNVGAFF